MTGGYLYFHKAPDPEAFHQECVRLVIDIHLYDGKRAGKATARWGLENRFPYLDSEFVAYYLQIDP